MKLKMFALISETSSKMSHVGSKTRSLGQILQKTCVPFRGQIFSPIIMKLCQNVFLDEISDEFKNGSCLVKKLGQVRSKTRSVGQILEKPCVCSRGHTFSPIIMKPH